MFPPSTLKSQRVFYDAGTGYVCVTAKLWENEKKKKKIGRKILSSLIRRQNKIKLEPVYCPGVFDYVATNRHTTLLYGSESNTTQFTANNIISGMGEGGGGVWGVGSGRRYDRNCIKENSIHLLKVLRGTLSYICIGSQEPGG